MKRFLAILLCVTMILSFGTFASARESEKTSGELYLHIGSPIALSGENIVKLDSTNPDVAPVIYKDRTLIPLRAVSEHFDADVDYDSEKREAVIKTDRITAVFPIDQSYYTINGERNELDCESIIKNSRTMVPLRAIAEKVLGLSVEYKDGVIALTIEKTELTEAKAAEVKVKIGSAVKVGSIDELKAMIVSNRKQYFTYAENAAKSTVAMDAAAPAAELAVGGDGGYSSTNVQVEGIDEADIVKTDGKFIYVSGNNRVILAQADNGSMTKVSEIRINENSYVNELYIDENRVVLIGNRWEEIPRDGNDDGDYRIMEGEFDKAVIYPHIYRSREFTFVKVYDTTNPANPTLLKEYEIEGYLASSRKNGTDVYLITNYYVYDENDFIPLCKDGGVEKHIAVEDVMCFPGKPAEQYLTVSSIDIAEKDTATEVEAILGSGYDIYMNENALYVSSYDWNDAAGPQTKIVKFAIDGRLISFAGAGLVPGNLLNQFSMDEYNGNLRVATTSWTDNGRSNNIFVLGQSLNIIGSIRNLAKDESIYSVRFMGNVGYVVTYRTVDPLFVIDLSNPTSPFVTGELKVPGFSNYLHPVSENMLLGIGRDTYEIYKKQNGRDVPVGTMTGGIKLSLFDVSNMTAPREVSTLVLGDNGSYADALYNHKAITFNKEKGYLAFDGSLYEYVNAETQNTFNGAFLIDYSSGVLSEKGRLEYKQVEQNYENYIDMVYGRRIVYIGDVIYYVQDGLIRSFDANTLSPISTIDITK